MIERMSAAYAVHYLSKTFWAGLFVGMFLFGVFSAIAIWITVQIPVALFVSPVQFTNLQYPDPAIYCPGDIGTATGYLQVEAESIVNTYYSTINADRGTNVLGSQGEIGPRLYPSAIAFTSTVSFSVPSTLSPGMYKHVRASIALNKDSVPAFIEIPFEVKACE